MFGDIIQPTHLIFILVVALVVLGPKRLPEVGRSLGKGIRDFRGAMSGLDEHTSDLRSTFTAPLEVPAPVTPATTSVSDAGPSSAEHGPDAPVPDFSDAVAGESVATIVIATPSPAPDTMPLDRAGVEAATADNATHVEPEAAEPPLAGPGSA